MDSPLEAASHFPSGEKASIRITSSVSILRSNFPVLRSQNSMEGAMPTRKSSGVLRAKRRQSAETALYNLPSGKFVGILRDFTSLSLAKSQTRQPFSLM